MMPQPVKIALAVENVNADRLVRRRDAPSAGKMEGHDANHRGAGRPH